MAPTPPAPEKKSVKLIANKYISLKIKKALHENKIDLENIEVSSLQHHSGLGKSLLDEKVLSKELNQVKDKEKISQLEIVVIDYLTDDTPTLILQVSQIDNKKNKINEIPIEITVQELAQINTN